MISEESLQDERNFTFSEAFMHLFFKILKVQLFISSALKIQWYLNEHIQEKKSWH